uniref:SymE family type I addiction module toxin n=2 Tax=Xanthomonas axonopodis TaxID=53413 RepID=UPI001F14FA83|nr:SymE family type I addiction module toxin [Xanthomonas axonopodis]
MPNSWPIPISSTPDSKPGRYSGRGDVASQQRVPALRLRGRWLEQLGFAIGSKLSVTVQDCALVITVIGEECMRRCKVSR